MAHILDGDGLRTRAGWRCPGCSRCWNPDVLACHHCPAPQPPAFPEVKLDILATKLCVPDVMASGGHWYARVGGEWTEMWPGLECRYGGSDSGPDTALINFRLTPADGSP